ncbi:MAG TPA: hypothetical protein VF193_12820 [Steroidobacter sp.]
MTRERDPDPEATQDEATVKLPRPIQPDEELEDIDPEKTLVREDWESTVIRRVAPRVNEVQEAADSHPEGEERFGWESEGLKRLSREVKQLARGN